MISCIDRCFTGLFGSRRKRTIAWDGVDMGILFVEIWGGMYESSFLIGALRLSSLLLTSLPPPFLCPKIRRLCWVQDVKITIDDDHNGRGQRSSGKEQEAETAQTRQDFEVMGSRSHSLILG
jgi:hypothetical protein